MQKHELNASNTHAKLGAACCVAWLERQGLTSCRLIEFVMTVRRHAYWNANASARGTVAIFERPSAVPTQPLPCALC